jgi:HK97 family phage portal protein
MSLIQSIADSVAALLPKSSLVTLRDAGLETKSTWYPETAVTRYDLSGPVITPTQTRVDYAAIDALGSSIVMACVNSVTRCFPESRLRVMRRDRDGGSVEVPNHPIGNLLARPNEFMTAYEVWQATLADYNITGNAYWWKIRGRSGGGVRELYPVPARLMRAVWPKNGSEYISWYEMWTPNGWKRVEAEDVVHFRNGLDDRPGMDCRYGRSPLDSVRREIFVDEEAGNYSATVLRNVGVVGAVFTPKEPTPMGEEDKAAFRAAYSQAYGGDNRGKPMIFEIPMDVQKIAFSAEDMDMDSLRAVCEERISALLNVPAIVAGLGAGLDRSTYSNMEEAYRQLWEANIIPTQRAMTERLDVSLLTDFGAGVGLFTDFDRSQVTALGESRDNIELRAREAFKASAITRNEVRERLGYPADPGGEVYYDGTVYGVRDAVETAQPVALRAVAGMALPPVRPLALAAKADDTPDMPRPTGKPIDWTDDDLDALAEISEDDIAEAQDAWKRHAPRAYRDLLDATEPKADDALESKRNAPPAYRWNAGAQRFVNGRGKFVPLEAVRGAVEETLDGIRGDMRALGAGLESGSVSIPEFQLGMQKLVKQAHLSALAAARGGWDRLTPADYAKVGPTLRDEYKHLNRAVSAVASGDRSVKSLLGNLDMWAADAGDTFDNATHAMRAEVGHKWERWVLGAAEHCEGCIEQAGRGVVRYGSLPAKGSQPCGSRCHCRKQTARRRKELEA